jgi:gamma-glutamylcyclotransferase (GGCT)/AIG2-like uncharacterized protein YtfP
MKNKRYPLLYLAYGANTQVEHMASRCPTAVPVGTAVLHDYKLVFRGVADVVPQKKSEVHVAAWDIKREDEAALDRFEGYPRLYIKRYAIIEVDGVSRVAMFYVMAGDRLDQHEPPLTYEQTLRAGYEHFTLPAQQINDAIRRAMLSRNRKRTYKGKWDRPAQPKAAEPAPKPALPWRAPAPAPKLAPVRAVAQRPVDDPTDDAHWEYEYWRARGYPDWYALEQATRPASDGEGSET